MIKVNADLFRVVLTVALVVITTVMLFVPVADGTDEIRSMFMLLTAIVVVDYFRSTQEDKRVKSISEAYDPTPSPSTVFDDQETQVRRR